MRHDVFSTGSRRRLSHVFEAVLSYYVPSRAHARVLDVDVAALEGADRRRRRLLDMVETAPMPDSSLTKARRQALRLPSREYDLVGKGQAALNIGDDWGPVAACWHLILQRRPLGRSRVASMLLVLFVTAVWFALMKAAFSDIDLSVWWLALPVLASAATCLVSSSPSRGHVIAAALGSASAMKATTDLETRDMAQAYISHLSPHQRATFDVLIIDWSGSLDSLVAVCVAARQPITQVETP